MDNEQYSLNKYISSSGFCSRREADKLIEQGRVTLNGEPAVSSTKVITGDEVEVDGEPLKTKKKPIYIAFNKPVGVTSTTDTKDKSNIIYYINHPKRIFPVGRLDKDSDGLIFLTNDGDIVNKILRASNNHEKEYIVTVDKLITPEFIRQMGNGVPVLETMTRECFVRQEGGRRFRITLTQGLNRQIRRMCEYLGYEVRQLTRVRIMNVQLANMPVGNWRYLTPQEVDKMNELVAESSKVDTVKKTKKVKVAMPKPMAPTPAPVIAKGKPEPKGKPETKGKPDSKGKPVPKSKAGKSERPEYKAPEPVGKAKKKGAYAEFRSKRR